MDKSLASLATDSDYDPNSMPVAKAREYIRAFLTPVAAVERLHLRAALGRVLAQDVLSTMNVPANDNSAMDGYAVRATDLQGDAEIPLTVVGSAFAGKPFEGIVGAGHAVRIMTGGVMPAGADTVVMQERVRTQGDRVLVPANQPKGQNVRYAGDDIKQDAQVFAAGQVLRPAEIGMIASLGIGEVSVYRKLRVAFFSTGDELVSIGSSTRRRPDLRQQPLHHLRHALAPRCRDDRHGIDPRRSGFDRASFRTSGTRCRRRHHERRRIGWRGGFRQADSRAARRSAVLEDCDEAGTPAGIRQNRRRAFLRIAGQPGERDGDVLPVRARSAARADGRAETARAAHAQSRLHDCDQESARTHRISARDSEHR